MCIRDREDTGGARYILTVIDCFSRYPWLIPIRENKSSEIADCLMKHVFLGECMFPVVIRSDNGPEYMGDIIKELNKLLGITHITGSAYHPQSQGMAESMHKPMNQLVRGLVQDHPEDWEARMPYCQAILRIMPMKVLGGRCPYEVVTGLKPKLPSALDPHSRIEAINVGEYCDKLQEFFSECYSYVCLLYTSDAADE